MSHPTYEQLVDYVDQKLNAEQRQTIEMHLQSCARCRADLGWLQDIREELRSDDWVVPPVAVRSEVQRAFRERYPAPQEAAAPSFLAWLRQWLTPSWQPALIVATLLIVVGALLWRSLGPAVGTAAAVTETAGTVEVRTAAAESWSDVVAGDAIVAGASLRTGADGSVLITFPGSSTARLFAETALDIDVMETAPPRIALMQMGGASEHRVTVGTEYQVSTPAAVITTTEGAFTITVDEANTTLVAVSAGRSTVSAAGDSLIVREGEQAEVVVGLAPVLVTDTATETPTATPTATETPTPTPSPTRSDADTPVPVETVAPPSATSTPPPSATPAPPPSATPAPPPSATSAPPPTQPPPPTEQPDPTPEIEPTEEPDEPDDTETPESTEEPEEPDDTETPEPTEEHDPDDDDAETPEPDDDDAETPEPDD